MRSCRNSSPGTVHAVQDILLVIWTNDTSRSTNIGRSPIQVDLVMRVGLYEVPRMMPKVQEATEASRLTASNEWIIGRKLQPTSIDQGYPEGSLKTDSRKDPAASLASGLTHWNHAVYSGRAARRDVQSSRYRRYNPEFAAASRGFCQRFR
jgi:hypothetical protein